MFKAKDFQGDVVFECSNLDELLAKTKKGLKVGKGAGENAHTKTSNPLRQMTTCLSALKMALKVWTLGLRKDSSVAGEMLYRVVTTASCRLMGWACRAYSVRSIMCAWEAGPLAGRVSTSSVKELWLVSLSMDGDLVDDGLSWSMSMGVGSMSMVVVVGSVEVVILRTSGTMSKSRLKGVAF